MPLLRRALVIAVMVASLLELVAACKGLTLLDNNTDKVNEEVIFEPVTA